LENDHESGPTPVVATDVMYDVPCEKLVDALEALVRRPGRSRPSGWSP
jgi:hypothetical protein